MESTGEAGQIHLSQEVVDQLLDADKSHWVSMRHDKVTAKGKGILNTFWLNATCPDLVYRRNGANSTTDATSTTGSTSGAEADPTQSPPSTEFQDRNGGLVDWNAGVMRTVLLEIASYHRASTNQPASPASMRELEKKYMIKHSTLSEVKEIVSLPKFDAAIAQAQASNQDEMELGDEVTNQLRSYVHVLSTLYR